MTQREDIFRLPPLTMAEAKVLNTIVQLNLPEDLVESPEILRKIRVLSSQVMVAMEYDGKIVTLSEKGMRFATAPSNEIKGKVVEVITHEEYKERDWEDMDDYREDKRGTMLITVLWRHPDGSEELEKGYQPDDLVVIES